MSLEIGNQPRIVMLIDKCEKSTCNRETLCGVISVRCDSSHSGHHMENMPGGKCTASGMAQGQGRIGEGGI